MTISALTSGSETVLLEFMDTIPDGLLICDGNIMTSVNRAGVRILKAQKMEDLTGQTVFDVFHPDFLAVLATRVAEQADESRAPQGEEMMMIARDGTEVPVDVRLFALSKDGHLCTGVIFHDLTEQKKNEQKLRHELDFSNAIISSMPGIFYQFDADGRFLRWNKNHEKVTGYSGDDYSGLHVHDLFPEADRERVQARIAEVFVLGQSSVETDLRLKNGSTIPYHLTGVHVDYSGESSFVGVGIDITGFRQAEQALHEQNVLFDALLESTIEGILVIDEKGITRVHNQRLTDIWKVPPHIVDSEGSDVLFDFFSGQTTAPEEFTAHLNTINNHLDGVSHDEIELTDGTMVERYSAPVKGRNGQYYGRIWTFRDVTQKYQIQKRIQHLAHHDSLTGLPNRHSAQTHLEKALLKPGTEMCLLYIDLDGFKRVNDTRGHHAGDTLLQQASSRLAEMGENMDMFIARLGGDEFIGIVACANLDLVTGFAHSIIQTLSEPYYLCGDRQVIISASIGIASAPAHGQHSGELLSRSDIALYAAKATGKGTIRVFSPEMEEQLLEQMQTENELQAALDSTSGIFVFYQPIVDVVSGRVTAREALIRWYQPARGWISPADFIPVAEKCGLIDRVGLFVLSRACHDAVNWEDGARVAVNISAEQLGKGNLVQAISAALTVSGLNPERLEIEITETALLVDKNATIEELHQIRTIGVHVALDDFGTGYSSLSHLQIFPFDKIKIDCSFVQNAIEKPDCAAIVRAVAGLGRQLGVTTVAEGVETEAHLNCVRDEGCTEYQGYLYSPPVPMPEDAKRISDLITSRCCLR